MDVEDKNCSPRDQTYQQHNDINNDSTNTSNDKDIDISIEQLEFVLQHTNDEEIERNDTEDRGSANDDNEDNDDGAFLFLYLINIYI